MQRDHDHDQHSKSRRINAPNPEEGSEEDGKGVTYLTLSLFIILLAFFILLHSVSDFEPARIKPVMDSIEKSFGRQMQGDTLFASLMQSPAQGQNEGTEEKIREGVRNAFHSAYPELSSPEIWAEGLVFITLPLERLALRMPYVALAEALSLDRNWTLEIVLHSSGQPNLEQVQAYENLIGILTDRFRATGLPEQALSFTFRQGNIQDVLVFIRPYAAFTAGGV